LNPDTQISGDALGIMLEAAERERAPTIIGPQIISPQGVPQSCSARKLPTLGVVALRLLGLERIRPSVFQRLTAYRLDQEQRVEAISGACTLAAREVFVKIGLLDVTLPMGGEDIDWYWRARSLGIPIRYVPAARIIHIGGASRALALTRTDLAGVMALYFYFKKHGKSYITSGYLLLLFFTTILKAVFLTLYWPFSRNWKPHVKTKLTVCFHIVLWILIGPKR
jgi:GT2 family glycosyltransferase